MKIGEAQQIYRDQVSSYRKQKNVLSKQLEDVRGRMKYLSGIEKEDSEKRKAYESEAATLQLTLDALDEKQEEYQDYLDRLADQYCAYWNAEVEKQQKDAAKEYAADMAKLMEVARRIMKGDIVPASDEKKLMEYSEDLYQTAKNIGALARREKREKHDSLWDDEEKKENYDPREAAENAHAASDGPEIVDAADLAASFSSE